ncbi:basic leucine zipper transcriptional factor ATF-like 2 [Myripristis murdjan]|uniref:basic leucine zipper transcriptional factor ATF-like 2 n=1 Tax=Myripristis murdjan TaxID=586833 RepID=UPI0011763FEC|nr:basic leucine zipper transcriptional factor ATF-like 2 [Myripristis murdjan]
MPPLFMETRSDPDSPFSVSAEERQSNTPDSDKGGEVQQTGERGGKRREKNRDAARRSRKKQTERADELHEELQRLERSNTALEKEIAALKKDLKLYTKVLERHEPVCRLRGSASSPAACLLASSTPSIPPQTSSSVQDTNFLPSLGSANQLLASTSPPVPIETTPTTIPMCSSTNTVPPLTSYSSFAAPLPLSTFLTSDPGLHTLPCPPDFHVSTSIPALTTNTSSMCSSSSTDLFASSSPSIDPTSSIPNSSSPLVFPGLSSATIMPPKGDSGGLEAQACPENAPQRHPGQFTGTLHLSNPQCSLSQFPFQDSAFPVCPQTNLDLPPAPALSSTPTFSQENAANPTPLRPLVTVPSPLDAPQTTSSVSTIPNPGLSFNSLPISQPGSSLFTDPSRNISLYDFLECDEWIPGNATCRWDM